MITEDLRKEKAQNYLICYSEQCEKREHCLRNILKQYVNEKMRIVQSVNLGNHDVIAGMCPMFKSDEKVRFPVGLTRLYDDIPMEKAQQIKRSLIEKLGRSNYYRYRNGELRLKKKITDIIESTMLRYGWNEPPRYDGYADDYLW